MAADVVMTFPAKAEPLMVLAECDLDAIASRFLAPEFSGQVVAVTLFLPGVTPGLIIETRGGGRTIINSTGEFESSSPREFVSLFNTMVRRWGVHVPGLLC